MDGLTKEGIRYQGVLYLGGMVTNGKVYVIEFNARWGDPEAEVILPSIENDLFKIVSDIKVDGIRNLNLNIDKKVRVAVAACAKGYPSDYSKVKGKKVTGIEKTSKIPGIKIYGAGIKRKDKDYVVSGGRVLFLMGEGKNVIEARKQVYQAIAQIRFEGDNLHFRSDIGWRDVERLQKERK